MGIKIFAPLSMYGSKLDMLLCLLVTHKVKETFVKVQSCCGVRIHWCVLAGIHMKEQKVIKLQKEFTGVKVLNFPFFTKGN